MKKEWSRDHALAEPKRDFAVSHFHKTNIRSCQHKQNFIKYMFCMRIYEGKIYFEIIMKLFKYGLAAIK